ncbi:MAG: hypothetical protein U0531_09455 [Dehalococcoidia bacterium]
MELLHSGVHRGFRRDLDRADLLSGDFTTTILTVLCRLRRRVLRQPVAPRARADGAGRAEGRPRPGARSSRAGCPDHGHRMEIEPGPE